MGTEAGGALRVDAAGEQRRDHAGEHVAGPRGRQPGVPRGGEQHRAVGTGDDGRRALEQHHRGGAGREVARGGDAVVAGPGPAQAGEFAVVGRQHDRACVRPASADHRGDVRRGAEVVEPVGVDDGRHRRGGDEGPHRGAGGVGVSEAGADHEGAETVELGEDDRVPAVGREAHGDRLAGRMVAGGDAGAADVHHARAAALRRPRAELGRAAHPGGAGDDPHRARPLVRGAGAVGEPGPVGVLHEVDGRIADGQADVGDLDPPAARRTLAEKQAGLERRHGDGDGGVRGVAADRTGVARHP